MNFHYVLSSDPQYHTILQLKINGRYHMEYKYDPMQSKVLLMYKWALMLSLLLLFILERCHCIDYTHLHFLLCDTVYY